MLQDETPTCCVEAGLRAFVRPERTVSNRAPGEEHCEIPSKTSSMANLKARRNAPHITNGTDFITCARVSKIWFTLTSSNLANVS